jgi:hypothetical protein
MCKLKQRERLGTSLFMNCNPSHARVTDGKKQTTPKADKAFVHHLSIQDARRHLPQLRSIAAREFPNTPVQGLVICIDYRVIPENYSVRPVMEHSGTETSGTANEEARNDALIEKVRDNQDKYTLLESKIANGQDGQLVMTLCSSFWDKDCCTGSEEGFSDDDDDDPNPKTVLRS